MLPVCNEALMETQIQIVAEDGLLTRHFPISALDHIQEGSAKAT